MAFPLKIDEALFEYATPRQRELLEAVNIHGSAKAASIALGINVGAASDAYIAVKKKAALRRMRTQGESRHERLAAPKNETPFCRTPAFREKTSLRAIVTLAVGLVGVLEMSGGVRTR